jgi:hypothetical protein
MSVIKQEALPRCIGQLSVTHLHLELQDLHVIRDGERIHLAKHEEERDAYVRQLAKASHSLRYLKVSAGKAHIRHWRVDREGAREDGQPTLTRLSRDEGERIAAESLQMSSST